MNRTGFDVLESPASIGRLQLEKLEVEFDVGSTHGAHGDSPQGLLRTAGRPF